jgi:hypothetical protein
MTETTTRGQLPEDETNRLAFLPVLAFGVGLVVILAYYVYFGVWKQLPAGGPDTWANFGDYFGGVVNPVAGVVTVFLVFFTLKATRKEARDTRTEMQEQRRFFVTQQRLTDLHRSLEGVMAEWRLLIERRTFVGYIDPRSSATHADVIWRRLFEEGEYRVYAEEWRIGVGHALGRSDISDEFEDAIELLQELETYCRSYDAVVGNSDLTDFYRRRVSKAATLLESWGLIDDDLAGCLRA